MAFRKGDLVQIQESLSEKYQKPGLFLGIYQSEQERPFTGGVALVLFPSGVEKVMMKGLRVIQ